MKYNPTKTVVMCMTDRKDATLPNVKLCGESLTCVDKVKHLGSRVNNIRAMFPKAHDRIIKELFNSKCTHLYGCETWDQSDPSIYVECIRLGTEESGGYLTYHTPHTPDFCSFPFTCTPHAKEQVFIRFYKMVRTMMKSYNTECPSWLVACHRMPGA